MLFLMKMNLTSTKVFSTSWNTHISILVEEIDHYFPDLEDFQKYYRFVNSPFGTSVGDLPSQDKLLQEQLFDLVNDGNAICAFSEKSCSDFWIEMALTYPDISKMALKVLIPFPTTYECESAFSSLLSIKPTARNRLDAIHDMRVALYKTEKKHSRTDSTEGSAPVTLIQWKTNVLFRVCLC